jgi:diguanylate cyclase (GGDEF)-like protein
MIDVDHFKQLNDSHGHPVGDAVLADLGRTLDGACRVEDIACRYGGEEFTMVLPGASLEIARERAEQLRASVEGRQAVWQGRTLPPISISVGLAMVPANGTRSDEVLRAGDRALYRAKQAGWNRVVESQVS